MDLSRTWKVTACCIALAMLVMPLHAQDKEAENVKKKNEVLLKQIQAIAKDTTELKNRISENRKQLQQKQDTLSTTRCRPMRSKPKLIALNGTTTLSKNGTKPSARKKNQKVRNSTD